ncbi:MAG: glycosyltransferase, partial [Actinomycetota bacterium]|nr:glycosyltransferase [Actinomycetota bacterium]
MSKSGIDAFHAGMTEALTARPDLDVEFVYVNDGSLDESLARLIALQRADARIRIVDLSRNFGHQLA